VRGLALRLNAQTDVAIEFWGWSGEIGFDVGPPHRVLRFSRMAVPEYRGAWLFAQLAMRLRARKSNVNAVHITDPSALTPLGRREILTTVYDLIPLKQGMGKSQPLARAGYSSYLRALKTVDTVFAISDQTANDLVNLLHIPGSRIQIARPGVDLPPSDGRRVEHLRSYFLFIGGPNPNKNLGVVLQAMKICEDLPEELLIAGHWLPKQVEALNVFLRADGLSQRVRHIGFVPSGQLQELMRRATALIVPSLLEGFGLPVAEGLAAGALVVHSRLSVLEATSAGTALTFDPRSAVELATCLRRAVGEPSLARDLRRRGLERANEFTWDAAVSTTLAAYRTVMAR
jgi:glycosyltransferase involved in cell wall biosynthesis